MEVLVKENILIIQTAFLGDSILTLPMIQKLKGKYPNSKISVLCIPSTKEIFENSLSVDEVLIYDKKYSQKSFYDLLKLIGIIRKKKYTHVFSPHRSARSALITCLSGANLTFGFDIAAMSFLYKTQIKYQKNNHEVARNLDLIGYDTSGNRWKILPEIILNPETIKKINNFPPIIDKNKIIAIAPGSVWNTKIYPHKYFINIIESLIDEKTFIVLIGGKEDEILCNEIEKFFSFHVKSFAGVLNVKESIALLQHCSVLLSNDSAPTHLGMIANIPTIAIYCSTVPSFGFYPYNNESSYISYDELDCKPCGIHGYRECPLKTFDCGYKLLPGIIISKLKEKNIL
jgi:heptosyltransferase-2